MAPRSLRGAAGAAEPRPFGGGVTHGVPVRLRNRRKSVGEQLGNERFAPISGGFQVKVLDFAWFLMVLGLEDASRQVLYEAEWALLRSGAVGSRPEPQISAFGA